MKENDEPSADDKLNRGMYARSLAAAAEKHGTPLVVGLYGDWGSGKSSLMLQIEKEVRGLGTTTLPVRFNAWRHQFDGHPSVGLLQALAAELRPTEAARSWIVATCATLLKGLFRSKLGVDFEDIVEFRRRYESDRHLVRDAQQRLLDHFKDLIAEARRQERQRIVFFVDDLDRCQPDQILAVLESLKLFLNEEHCVYFMAANRPVIEAVVERREDVPAGDTGYLDKIVQLPFIVPPVEEPAMRAFVSELLPEELAGCREILERGLGGNPRSVKRFLRLLRFWHGLAREMVSGYDPRILAVLRLIEYTNPDFYRECQRDPQQLIAAFEDADALAKIFGDDPDLLHALSLGGIDRKSPEELAAYMGVTQVSASSEKLLMDGQGFYTEEGIRAYVAESGRLAPDDAVTGVLLIFKTRKQRTWLVASRTKLVCVLDGEQTRARDRIIQWVQPLGRDMHVDARVSGKGNNVVDVGNRQSWLYSAALHPDPDELVKAIRALIEAAAAQDTRSGAG